MNTHTEQQQDEIVDDVAQLCVSMAKILNGHEIPKVMSALSRVFVGVAVDIGMSKDELNEAISGIYDIVSVADEFDSIH
jgi:hypothetical protein